MKKYEVIGGHFRAAMIRSQVFWRPPLQLLLFLSSLLRLLTSLHQHGRQQTLSQCWCSHWCFPAHQHSPSYTSADECVGPLLVPEETRGRCVFEFEGDTRISVCLNIERVWYTHSSGVLLFLMQPGTASLLTVAVLLQRVEHLVGQLQIHP